MRFVGVRTGDVKASVTASVRVGAVCLAILLVEALGVGGGGRNVGVTGREMCSFVVVAGGQLELVGNLEVGVAGLAVGGDPGRRRTGEPLRSLADVTGQLCARGAPGARPGGGIASCRECGKGLKMETNIGERFVYSYAGLCTVLTKSHVVNLEIHFTTGKCVVKVRPETSGTLERGERLCLKKDFETKVVNLEIHFTTGNCVVKVRLLDLLV